MLIPLKGGGSRVVVSCNTIRAVIVPGMTIGSGGRGVGDPLLFQALEDRPEGHQ